MSLALFKSSSFDGLFAFLEVHMLQLLKRLFCFHFFTSRTDDGHVVLKCSKCGKEKDWFDM